MHIKKKDLKTTGDSHIRATNKYKFNMHSVQIPNYNVEWPDVEVRNAFFSI